MNRGQLEQILSIREAMYKRFLLSKEDKKLIVWGVGATADIYTEAFRRLENSGIHIWAFCDNNLHMQGENYNGKIVLNPSEVPKDAFVCICTAQPEVYRDIAKQLDGMEILYCHIDEMIFKLHKTEVLKVYDMLEDDRSKETYAELIVTRMLGIYPDERLYCQEQYFGIREFRKRTIGEVFVDCGAFVGDTIEQFLWMREGVLKKIIAIDADKNNFQALEKRVERLKEEWNILDNEIELIRAAVGAKSSDCGYYVESCQSNRGLSSRIKRSSDNANSGMEILALDDFFVEPYTFLKADIEGFEYNMLLGAKNSILKYKPKIAVCIYHNGADFYDIPLLIHAIDPSYKFAVRHHSFNWDETVLYAWCE